MYAVGSQENPDLRAGPDRANGRLYVVGKWFEGRRIADALSAELRTLAQWLDMRFSHSVWPRLFRLLFSDQAILVTAMRWCTVTVPDAEGRRHSVDVQATSTFDAAHLFVVGARKERAVGLPKPTLATVFEVVTAGRCTG
jgi:hypothetical protein